MCTGLEIAAAVAAAALSAGGAAITSRNAQQQAQAEADARNRVLQATLKRNDPLAAESRAEFKKTVDKMPDTPEASDTAQQRMDTVDQSVQQADTGSLPVNSDAPQIVKSTVAKRMADTFAQSKAQAKSLAKLGGYGDQWFDQGVNTEGARRNVGVDQNLFAGNMAIMPYMQDFAQLKARKPISPVGPIMQGVGSAIGGYLG